MFAPVNVSERGFYEKWSFVNIMCVTSQIVVYILFFINFVLCRVIA